MRLIAFVLALVAPVPALALSCLAPSVERSYASFAAAEETYIVVHGRLTLDVSKLPKGMSATNRPPRMTKIKAKLRGTSLGRSGFGLPFDQGVTLEVTCLSHWCGAVQNGEDLLAFVRKDADGYAMRISPCGGSVFATPKPAMLTQVERCMANKNCSAN